jgi:hypothetical protein
MASNDESEAGTGDGILDPNTDDPVSRWLTAANLAYAVPNFQMAGIVSPRSLAELELSYFEPLGVTKADDRKRLFYLIQKVKGEIERKKQTSKSPAQESRRDEQGDEDHRAGTSFQSPVISKVCDGRGNAGNHAHYLDRDGGGDYDDVIVSTVGSDTISPVTLASQIVSLSEAGHNGDQNQGGGSRMTDFGKEKNVMDKKKDIMEQKNVYPAAHQSFLPSVRGGSGGGGEGSNSSIVDAHSGQSSVGIHLRETVRMTNTSFLSVAAAATPGRGGGVVGRGLNTSVEQFAFSETGSDEGDDSDDEESDEDSKLFGGQSSGNCATIAEQGRLAYAIDNVVIADHHDAENEACESDELCYICDDGGGR